MNTINFFQFLLKYFCLSSTCFWKLTFSQHIDNFTPFQHQDDVNRIADSQASFTRDLYKTIANESDGNILFSPFSIGVALTMAYLGSDGDTEAEMRSVMSLPEDRNSTMRGFGEILSDLKSINENNSTLKITNRMYISHLLSVLNEYSNTLLQGFGSIPETVNFTDCETVRQLINEAIENDTESRIKELIPKGSFTIDTRLVLTNAVYFKAYWQNKFFDTLTRKNPFSISKNDSVEVDMMLTLNYFLTKYDNDLMSTVLKLKYEGERMSMIILLPDEESDLADLESKLTKNVIQNLETGLNEEYIRFYFPKFKIEIKTEMKEVLKNMGINIAFGDEANFEKITDIVQLKISDVFHKAFLEVNEHGSEASAATVVESVIRTVPYITQTIEVNRPFIFFIKDSKTHQILFAGRLTNPL